MLVLVNARVMRSKGGLEKVQIWGLAFIKSQSWFTAGRTAGIMGPVFGSGDKLLSISLFMFNLNFVPSGDEISEEGGKVGSTSGVPGEACLSGTVSEEGGEAGTTS